VSTTEVKINWQTVRHQVSIAGIVQDSKTKQAISGARVEIDNLQNTHSQKWTLTRADGWFYFLDLPSNQNYTLSTSLPGREPYYGSVSVPLSKIPKLDVILSLQTKVPQDGVKESLVQASAKPTRSRKKSTNSQKKNPSAEKS